MNTDKAYILGLVIGGGSFSSDNKSFYIKLPYKQWGDIDKHPERAGLIAHDILHVVKPLMMIEYDLDVSYNTGKEWRICCTGDVTKLKSDLRSFHIEPTRELRKTADITDLIEKLGDINMKKRFIAGLADTIGSMAPSHRRFSDDVQIISFEISGFNYILVCQICNLLYSVGCIPDQILWQHPNMQSGRDAYYTSWKKGNKIRVTLDSFSTFGSMAFKSKTKASRENMLREPTGTYNGAVECESKPLSVPGAVSVHIDESYHAIPETIRGGHYIHHKQICAALNCLHAPCKELDCLLSEAENYISPFTVLHKDDINGIADIISHDPLLNQRNYFDYKINASEFVKAYEEGWQTVLFEEEGLQFQIDRKKGYPLNEILNALAYIIASKTGNLNGKRPKGNRESIIMNAIKIDPLVSVTIRVPDLLTPIIITDGKVAAMVGPLNANVYRKLISFDESNKYKMVIRRITEEDLR